jgi:hypothetical protein
MTEMLPPEELNTPAGSDSPKPELPLDVLFVIMEIERKLKVLLDDCVTSPYPIVLESELKKATEIMRVGVCEAFTLRLEYYKLQARFCQSWLEEAAEETVVAVFNRLPFQMRNSIYYENSGPSISKELRQVLQARISAVPLISATLSKLPTNSAPHESLPKKRRGAPKKAEAEKTRARWAEMGKPKLAAPVCEELANYTYPDEYAKTKSHSPARKKLRDRIRRQVTPLINKGTPVASAT